MSAETKFHEGQTLRIMALSELLVEKGIITKQELRDKINILTSNYEQWKTKEKEGSLK